MKDTKSIQNVNMDKEKWDLAIHDARELLIRVENRAVRLKGAIKTFTELRDHGHEFNGPQSATDI